ncbi:MAG: 6-phosphogluconolactonase [Patescibacteria group bacterium]
MQQFVVSSDLKGLDLAKQKLEEFVDRKTVLFLSGGRTPLPLYKKLAKERTINPGAVAIVDERYGEPYHKLSNELSIKSSGFLDYIHSINTPFYSMLKSWKIREESAREYDELVHYLLGWFHKSVAILGLGNDGHIAGIAPNRSDFTNPLFGKDRDNVFVSEYKDPLKMSPEGSTEAPYGFGERMTLTFHALAQMDLIMLLVFGKDKKKGIKIFTEEGSVEEAPARFLKQSQITDKVLLITDQKI